MSLTQTNLLPVAKTQYRYKTKANARMFFGLIALQLLGLFFSLNGVGNSGGGGSDISYSTKYFSGDIILIITFIWAFVIGINTAGSGYKFDFTFVSNRLSSHLSSMAFLLTAAVIGGVTATLCGVLLRVIMYFSYSGTDLVILSWISPLALLSGIFVATLYAILLSTIGYFAGMLIQRSPVFNILLPVIFFGTLTMDSIRAEQFRVLIPVIEFFTKESSYTLFSLKVVIASALIYGIVILITARMEVRK